ncbi:MAG: hypothetical protein JSW46_17965 [Gemmatimonadota bacterium]|nr:MAG: hypothetical protein JSW46_17965 [Gemmatimonadota bacterium]
MNRSDGGYPWLLLLVSVAVCLSCSDIAGNDRSDGDEPDVLWLETHAVPINSADPDVGEPNLSVLGANLDLSRVDYSEAGAGWLIGPRNIRIIGADYCAANDAEYYYSTSLPVHYDGIVHFEDTNPTTRITF